MDILIPVIIVAVIGLISGVGLSLASEFMSVPTDEREEKVRECLPGANCGACGYSGCDGYAAAVASGEAEPDKCAPGGTSTAEAMAEILGVKVDAVPKIAFIACSGSRENSAVKYNYDGMFSCAAANLIQSGPLECSYGCIGYGDCVRACPFGAISLKDGKPFVEESLCVGCGKCKNACPKGVISIVNKGAPVVVACNNKDKGASVVKSCKVSCIACGLCEKNCPTGAIKIVDNLAQIDYSICSGCGKCKEVCRRKVIV